MTRKLIIIHSVIVAVVLAILGGLWLVERVDFFDPVWLLALLALPAFPYLASKGLSGLPPKVNLVATTVRSVLFLLAVALLADVQYVQHNERVCVLFLLDRSASIPEHIYPQQLTYVNGAMVERGRKDSAGIVVFAEDASVELTPSMELQVDRLYSAVSADYTDLQSAVELATAVFPEDARKKIVIISDGNENLGNILKGAEYAAANQVQIDVLPVFYSIEHEVLVEKVDVPDRIRENEPFDLKVHVRSTDATTGKLTIYQNGRPISSAVVDLQAGENTLVQPITVNEPGAHTYTARIEPATGSDTVPGNNQASDFVYIRGDSRVLFVSPNDEEVRYLVEACHEEKLETTVIRPSELPHTMEDLQNYDCIVLANVESAAFTGSQMENIRRNTYDMGVGLIMIGGNDSFGAGGYELTPIEEALPVSMDIKQKKINPKGALVLVLHTCEFEKGNYWAKEITKEAIKQVNPQDDVGVLYYDYQAQDTWLFDLTPAENKPALFNKVSKCEPGDMPSFAPAFSMAVKSLANSDAMVKHMIVISDGDPAAPRPADIKAMADAGITVSTVGINPHSNRDVRVLQYIASQTGGRYYFANNPEALPRIFVKEAKVVKRSLIFNERFQPVMVAQSELTKGIGADELPMLNAYVAATPKDRAITPIVGANENADPILSHWNYGLGKSVAFTSDATGNWGVDWVAWPKYKKFWGQTIRWASRKRDNNDVEARVSVEGGKVKLALEAIDADGEYVNHLEVTATMVNADRATQSVQVRQEGPGRYSGEAEVKGTDVTIFNVTYRNPATGEQSFDVVGVTVPYSPEYKFMSTNKALLERAAAMTGGKLMTGTPATDGVFESVLEPFRSSQGMLEKILILAIILLMADVIMRRVIITADELRAAWQTVLMRLPGRGVAEKDATMATLLATKKKVADRNRGDISGAPTRPIGSGRPAAEPTGDFRKKLQEQAKSATGEVEVANSGDAKTSGSARPGAPGSGTPAADAGGDDDSYTNRLLKAKRRARKDDDAG